MPIRTFIACLIGIIWTAIKAPYSPMENPGATFGFWAASFIFSYVALIGISTIWENWKRAKKINSFRSADRSSASP